MFIELKFVGIFFGIVGATILIAYLVNKFFQRLIKKSAKDLQNDPTNYQFIRHLSVALIYVVGFALAIYSVPGLKTIANSMLAGAGILAVAISFASQHALSNIVSGIFMVIFKPFRVGDRLSVRTFNGIVEDITLRHTVIRDFENKRILIPNALISDEILVNSDFVDDKICKWIDLSISYDSSIDDARRIIQEEVAKHPLHVDPRSADQINEGIPEVTVRVIGFGESAVNLRAWAWAKDSPDGFVLYCDLLESIKKRFDTSSIEIPFPHRTLVYKTNKSDDFKEN